MTGGKTTRGFNPQSHGKLWSIIPDPAPQIGELRVGELGVLFSAKVYLVVWWGIYLKVAFLFLVNMVMLEHPHVSGHSWRDSGRPLAPRTPGSDSATAKKWPSVDDFTRDKSLFHQTHMGIKMWINMVSYTHIHTMSHTYIYIYVCVRTPGPSKYPQNDVSVGLWLRYLCDQIHGGKICCMGEEKPLANLGWEGVIRLYARKMWSVLSVRKSKTWVR